MFLAALGPCKDSWDMGISVLQRMGGWVWTLLLATDLSSEPIYISAMISFSLLYTLKLVNCLSL